MARIIDAFTQFFDGNGDPLVNGLLKFYESGTNNTDKDTFADINESIANSNPVELDGEGRCPNVFGNGAYNVISYTSASVQIQQFDPVNDASLEGAFADWNSITVYGSGDLVIGSDGLYYRSLVTANQNNNPTASPTKWEEFKFVGIWNTNISYDSGDAIYGSDGFLYLSRTDTNSGNDPTTDTTNWRPGANVRLVKGADVASAAALTLGADGNYFDVTGATAITSIDTIGVGAYVTLQFDGILPLTHHATDLVLPNGDNIITYAGYIVQLYEYATGDFRFVSDNRTTRSDLPPEHFSGLILSNDTDTEHDINITAGYADDSTSTYSMILPSEMTKQIDATWAAGDDAGGMAATTTETGTFTTVTTAVTGVGSVFLTEFSVGDVLYSSSNLEARRITVITDNLNMTLESGFTVDVSVAENVQKNGLAPDTTYHTLLIRKDSDGSADAYFDISIEAANIPTGYTAYRRTGSILTDSNANIYQFTQNENLFSWNDLETDFSVALHTSRVSRTLKIPTGAVFTVIVGGGMTNTSINVKAWFGAINVTDFAPTNILSTLSCGAANSAQSDVMHIETNTSGQIATRCSTTGGNITAHTIGWIDDRRL